VPVGSNCRLRVTCPNRDTLYFRANRHVRIVTRNLLRALTYSPCSRYGWRLVVSDRTSLSAVRVLIRFCRFTSLLSILFGTAVLTGWAIGLPRLKSIVPGQVNVKANTALCFILLGVGFWLARENNTRFGRAVTRSFAFVVAIVGLLSILEWWYGWDLRIDNLLFTAAADDAPGSIRPGLMSPITAADFLVLGFALILLEVKATWSRWIQTISVAFATVAAVFGIFDYVLDPEATHTHIAPPTALLLFLFCFAVLLAQTDWGLGAKLVRLTPGGELCRRLLAAAIFIPLIIAWVGWKGQLRGLFSDWTGLLIMAVSSGLLLSVVVLWTSFALDRTDAERRRAEESAQHLASIVMASSDAIISENLDGIVTSWNPGAETVYGYTAAEVIGQPINRVIPSEKLQEFHLLMERVARGERVSEYEAPRIRKDGEKIHVALSVSPVRSESGHIIGTSTVARDITQRKRMETEIQISRERLALAHKAGNSGTFDWDIQNNVNVWTPEMEVLYGLSPGEFLGRYEDWESLVLPEDLTAAKACIESSFRTGEFAAEWRIRRRDDGQTRWIAARARIIYDDSHKPGHMIGINSDITDRKRAEEEIRALNRDLEKRVEQRTAELRESEERVRRKLDCILSPEGDLGHLELADVLNVDTLQPLAEDLYRLTGIPTAIIDLQGKFLVKSHLQEICTKFHRANPESCRNCIESDTVLTQGVAAGEFKIYKCKNNIWDGVTPLMIGGKHVGNCFLGQFFFADETIDREIFRAQATKYGFSETDYLAALDRVPRLTRAHVNATSAFFEKFAQVLSQLSYGTIKLARSAEQLSRANADLRLAVKDLEGFSYSVSHDLRAPLRHVMGFSKILVEDFGPKLPPDAQQLVQRIEDGTHRMGQLVDDLLNLGRVGRRELTLQVAGLRSIVDEVINSLKTDIEDRTVEWKIGELPYVECDTALMRQVFQNLLSNALKFTRPRSRAVIEIGQQQQDGKAVVYVRDNGVGFSMKYSDKLFGVFQRLHRTEDFEGTGVGLATVQRIVQKHGGIVWAQAELDKGATFYFTLDSDALASSPKKAAAAKA